MKFGTLNRHRAGRRAWTRAAAAIAAAALAATGCSAGTAADTASHTGVISAVGAENEYANVLSQIGGRYIRVSAIVDNPTLTCGTTRRRCPR